MAEQYTAKYVKTISTIELTRTQAIKIGLVDTDPDNPNSKLVVAIQKFWRKDNEDWREGKGFHLDYETSQQVYESLETANIIMDKTTATKPKQGWQSLVDSLS